LHTADLLQQRSPVFDATSAYHFYRHDASGLNFVFQAVRDGHFVGWASQAASAGVAKRPTPARLSLRSPR
jgi:hypothetical protein